MPPFKVTRGLFLAIICSMFAQVKSEDSTKDYCKEYCESNCYNYTGQEWLDCKAAGKDCSCSRGFPKGGIIVVSIFAVIMVATLMYIFFRRVRKRRNEGNTNTAVQEVQESSPVYANVISAAYPPGGSSYFNIYNFRETMQHNPTYQYEPWTGTQSQSIYTALTPTAPQESPPIYTSPANLSSFNYANQPYYANANLIVTKF